MNSELEKYLTQKFPNKKYPELSLIGIYWCDPQYYMSLLLHKRMDVCAAYFIAKYSSDLQKYHGKKRKGAFNNKNLHDLIRSFEKQTSLDQITWNDIDVKSNRIINKQRPPKVSAPKNSEPQPAKEPETINHDETRIDKIMRIGRERFENINFFCPYDAAPLTLEDVTEIKCDDNESVLVPQLKCVCCERLFTIVDNKEDFSAVEINGEKYTNLSISSPNTKLRPNISFNPYKLFPTKDKAEPKRRPCQIIPENITIFHCTWGNCSNRLLKATIKSRKSPVHERKMKFCPACGTFYISSDIHSAHKNAFYETDKKPSYSFSMPSPTPLDISGNEPQPENPKRKLTIAAKDFIIRKQSHFCIHRDHKIERVDALVNVIDFYGKVQEHSISAYYCPRCNLYYIMENTYEDLRRAGIPLCKMTDEVSYKQLVESSRGGPFAPESILMLHGYNVSQKDNIPTEQRRRILCEIIDHNICSKDHVIFILNNHIKLREKQSDPKYDLAISKWESDRDYIEKYHLGNNRQVRVKGFHRKHR